jgi:glycine/D-amino acid oxidase-like deaminating enzyme
VVHPHKLATALLNLAIQSGHCELYSWTPVVSIGKAEDGQWGVETSRGEIRARKVVLASNAHTEHVWHTPALPFKNL